MTGAELRAARKAAGLSQTALAQRAGLSRDTVQYWEAKGEFRRCGAGQVLAEALGLMVTCTSIARARGWGVSWQERADAEADAIIAAMQTRDRAREAQRWATRRVICGAQTRKGMPCRAKSEPGKARCKFHGGKSTGARTPEGLARIAEAQRRRWARVSA